MTDENKNPLRKPWIVSKNKRYHGPRILDCDGNPVCSFANQSRWRENGDDWAWMVARKIVKQINESYS